MSGSKTLFERRRDRARTQLRRKGAGRLRLSIHRTSRHIYAQIINDVEGKTLATASTLEADLKKTSGANISAASVVGKLIAQRAKKAGVEQVVFDRGGFLYHGRVKALADAAREGGLDF